MKKAKGQWIKGSAVLVVAIGGAWTVIDDRMPFALASDLRQVATDSYKGLIESVNQQMIELERAISQAEAKGNTGLADRLKAHLRNRKETYDDYKAKQQKFRK